MRNIFFLITLSLFLNSCRICRIALDKVGLYTPQNKYLKKNKEEYKVKVGKTFEIFYKNNASIRSFCKLSEKKNLNHIVLTNNKTIDCGPKDCDGCSCTKAYVFQAKSTGIDTVILKHYSPMGVDIKKYVVQIK